MARGRFKGRRTNGPPSTVARSDSPTTPAPRKPTGTPWHISLQGSVAPADVWRGRLRLLVFHRGTELAADALTSRMEIVLGDALRTDAADSAERETNELLQRAVRGLLDWREELEPDVHHGLFWALLFVNSEDAPAVAYIGGEPPVLTCDDAPLAPIWRSMRSGSEVARACHLRAGRAERIAMNWSGASAKRTAKVVAQWRRWREDADDVEDAIFTGTATESAHRAAKAAPDVPRGEAPVEVVVERAIRMPEPVRVAPAPAPTPAPAPARMPARIKPIDSENATPQHELPRKIESAPSKPAPSRPQAVSAAAKDTPAPTHAVSVAAPEATPRAAKPAPERMPLRHPPAIRALRRMLRHSHGRVGLGVTTAAALMLLYGFGRMIGTSTEVASPIVSVLSPTQRTLSSLGLGAGRFVCAVESDPPGSQIAVDGKSLGVATPMRVELAPGSHRISLSLARYGSRTLEVSGKPNEQVPLQVGLYGTIQVRLPKRDLTPVRVSVDGEDRGLAPLLVDHLSPGPHELEFSADSQEPWAKIVDVRVGDVTEVTVRPFKAPTEGILVVDATVENDEGGSTAHAQVWLDGKSVGRTPLSLTLPRGPHSVRGVLGGEQSPVQVIDLPGGNQRFASLRFGARSPAPQLALTVAGSRPSGSLSVKGTLRGVKALELSSMWLFVQRADGRWSRIALETSPSPEGAVGVGEIQAPAKSSGTAPRMYLSALRVTGEEYFTEIGAPEVQARNASRLMGSIP